MSITKKTASTKLVKKTISKKSKTIKNNDVLSDLKSLVLEEMSPILNTINISNIKKEILKEFNLEFSKLKNQFNSFEKTNSNVTDSNLEEMLSKKLSSIIESTIALHKKNENQIDDLKKTVSMLSDVSEKIDDKTNLKHREDERKQAQFIVNKVNEVVDKMNDFEDEFNVSQKKIFSNYELNIENQFEQVEKRIRQELLHRVEIELQASHQDFTQKENIFEKDLSKFKTELSSHVKEYILSLDKELKTVTKKSSELSLKEKDFMQKVKIQIGMDVSVLENKISDFKVEMDELLLRLNSKKEKKIFNDEMRVELSKQLSHTNEELTRISLTAKESVASLTNDIEDKLFNQIESFKNDFDKELLSFTKELNSRDVKLADEISILSSDREGLANERQSFNDKFSKLFLESKNQLKDAIVGIKQNNKELKGSITETISKKLSEQVEKFNKKYDTNFLKFEKKVSKFEDKFEKSLVAVSSERELLAVDRKVFEERFENAIEQTQERINSVFSKFEIENEGLELALTNVVSAKLNLQVEEFESRFTNHVNNFDEKLKIQESLLSEKVNAINSERNLLMKERDEIHNQVLEVLEDSKKAISEDLGRSNEIFDSLRVEVEDSLARNITISSDQLSKIKEESYLFRDSLKSEIEEKLIYSTQNLDREFKLSLEKFEIELKSKEENFIKKLLALEVEKESAISELSNFKSDLAEHTKSYINSLDEQLELIKSEERNFETEKDIFVGILEETTKARKLDIESFGNEVRDSISNLISDEKSKFDKSESIFRDTFNEKINNLHNFQKKKLESIEKKFIDKNLKFVENRVEQSLDMLKIVEDEITAKVLTIDKKVDLVNAKEDMLAENVALFEKKVNERVEERMMSLEKSFNSRIITLENNSKEKLNQLSQREREFVEDCAGLENEVNERVEERMMSLEKSFNSRMLSIEEDAKLKISTLANTETELLDDFRDLEIDLKENSEERLMKLEQSINKRVLDIDEDFSNFKNVVIEEMEDLMREVNTLMTKKVSQVDTHLNKINFAGSEIVKRVKDFDMIKNDLEKEVTFVRDDLNDLRVKQDNLPVARVDSSNLIANMSDYEQNIVHLIKSLKTRGISNDDILHTLLQKGHPSFYVKMIINQL